MSTTSKQIYLSLENKVLSFDDLFCIIVAAENALDDLAKIQAPENDRYVKNVLTILYRARMDYRKSRSSRLQVECL